ncbi:hypothetical protein SISNIDRAFT_409402 [Sistotremastrum niveocremeum HHB9708]|uniref:Efficient mitochondria targeting-associated protein 19 n=2 Tax=Sistotremastraceae TaxID=3402574 RepID=A0A164W1I7_9AGAM|nr:hypothetical protein SISNIDRAFT_409402 [Sistotremastrum niveocremeum HHB9708]KZT38159.1 hypothetical protein SISSUDRAFT_1047388 [Sistotremastrum suecicum HHB10207 ss-3]
MAPRPLMNRPFDLAYFTFFAIHILATLFVDLQALYPQDWTPSPINLIPEWYIEFSGDPLIAGAMGFIDARDPTKWIWIKSFMWAEALFQLPVFILGLRALYRDDQKIYPLLLIYAASSTTTMIPCVWTVLAVPRGTKAVLGITLTSEQLTTLLTSYVPFLLVTATMTVDMAQRLARLVNQALALNNEKKL